MTLDRLLTAVREARHGTIAVLQALATLLALGVLPAPYDRWAGIAIAVAAAAGVYVVPNAKPTGGTSAAPANPVAVPPPTIQTFDATGAPTTITMFPVRRPPLPTQPAPPAAETEPRTLP